MDQGKLEERTREWGKANKWVALPRGAMVEPMTWLAAVRLKVMGVMVCRRTMRWGDHDWQEYFVVGTN